MIGPHGRPCIAPTRRAPRKAFTIIATLIVRILELRREKAHLLGYRDFADLVLEDRMAKNSERALSVSFRKCKPAPGALR